MSTLSLRQLPKELERALLREAKTKNKTKTEIVISALENQFGLSPVKKKREQIRKFFGKMSARDYESFKKATRDFSSIEEDLWK